MGAFGSMRGEKIMEFKSKAIGPQKAHPNGTELLPKHLLSLEGRE